MKQVLVKGGEVFVEEVPPPQASRGAALVQVACSLISSGTESGFVAQGGTGALILKKAKDPLNIEKVKRKIASVGIKGTLEVIKGKLFEFQAPGYSSAGVIVDCGEDLHGFRVGDRVACAGVGYASHAEFNAVPHQLLTPIPDGVSFEEAAYVSLGAIAMQGVRQAGTTFGETVIIVGLGLLGQLAAQIARAAGCHVIGCDPVEGKRALAQELGAEAVCAPDELADTVALMTGGYGADAVIICAASKGSEVTRQACDLARQKGRVVVVGAVGMELEREPMYLKELDFRLSCSYGPGRYNPNYEERGLDYPIAYVRWTEGRNMAEFLRMIATGRVQVKPLISLQKPVDEAAEAYKAILAPGPTTISALITYPQSAADKTQPKRTLVLRGTSKGNAGIGVAVIGAGGFATGHHLPNLKRIAGCHLEAVVARTGSKAKQAAEKFGARACSTDYREVLAMPEVQAVVIATRHDSHKAIAIAAAEAGKHVFVEKPLALTVEDCDAILAAAEKSGVLVSVGFNRRFSTHARALKAALARAAGPKMITYRCNAGPLPANHWAVDPVEGGGRIVGEAVHFFDLCAWLVGEDPSHVSAERIGLGLPGAPAEDNLSIAMRFPGGSLATVIYTSLGHAALGKERIEAFAGGGAAVLEDYRAVSFHGMPGTAQKTSTEDKGQAALMENFIRAIRGEAELEVTGQHGLRATRIAVEALRSANGAA